MERNGQLYVNILSNFLNQINPTHPSKTVKLLRHKVLVDMKELENRKINKEREKNERQAISEKEIEQYFEQWQHCFIIVIVYQGKIIENDICRY